jgi:molybdopterin/thiamine biosynthesis adenylyltransferase
VNSNKFKNHYLLKEIGKKGQEKFSQSKILIIGLGGIGSPLGRYLASSGIGQIGIIDDDIIEENNLPRQNNYDQSHLGELKTEVTAKILRKLNPAIEIEIISKRANQKLLENTIPNYEYIIDATDNFKTKFLLSDLCHKLGKIFISGSFIAFKGYFSIYKSGIDKLQPCYRCFHEKTDPLQDKACYNQGVFAPGVGILGTFIAAETLKDIIGLNSITSKIMHLDFLTNNHRITKLNKNPNCNHK